MRLHRCCTGVVDCPDGDDPVAVGRMVQLREPEGEVDPCDRFDAGEAVEFEIPGDVERPEQIFLVG